MAAGEVFVGDEPEIRVEIQEDDAAKDISSASAMKITLRAPNAATGTEYTASFVGTGTDGLIKYQTLTGEIDTPGDWDMQAKITLSGRPYFSEVVTFTVLESIPTA